MTRQPALFRGTGLPAALKPAFDAFWAAYPPRRPNPRALAEAAFVAAVKGGQRPEDLAAAARAYATECRAQGIAEAFVVHAATFIRQGRFLDYLPAAGAPAAAAAAAEPDHPLWPQLRGRVPAPEFAAWLGKCRAEITGEGEQRIVLVEAPSPFLRDHVRREFGALLRSLAPRVLIRAAGDPI